jgi:hypothetical protein
MPLSKQRYQSSDLEALRRLVVSLVRKWPGWLNSIQIRRNSLANLEAVETYGYRMHAVNYGGYGTGP